MENGNGKPEEASPTRLTRTYVELWHGADILIKKGMAEKTGSRWAFLSALLMLSFCLEAYINFAGPVLFGPAWLEGPDPYVGKSARARLRLIAAACGFELEGRRKYWTVAVNLLELRASMTQAQQRPLEAYAGPSSGKKAGDHRLPEPSWSIYCSARVVLDYQSVLRGLLEGLQAALPGQGEGNRLLR